MGHNKHNRFESMAAMKNMDDTNSAIVYLLGFNNRTLPDKHRDKFIVKEIGIVIFNTHTNALVEQINLYVKTSHMNIDNVDTFSPKEINYLPICTDSEDSFNYKDVVTKLDAIFMYYNIYRVLYDYNTHFYYLEEFFRRTKWYRPIYWIRTFAPNQEMMGRAVNKAIYILKCLQDINQNY
jgi:hypothetical protein